MNKLYSWVDATFPAPQNEQHLIIQIKADLLNSKIIFYGSEDPRFAKEQPFILTKLLRTPNINGVIFFTFDQFCYSDKFNLKLLNNIIINNLSIHFARENLSFFSSTDLERYYLQMISYFNNFQRNKQDIFEISKQI